jgi:hypothetical protein
MLDVSPPQVSLDSGGLQIDRAYWTRLAPSNHERWEDLLIPLPVQHRMESLSQVPIFFKVFESLFRKHIGSRSSLFGILGRTSGYQFSLIW